MPGRRLQRPGVNGGSFSWTVPDDGGVGNARLKRDRGWPRRGIEAASGIEGSVSGVQGTAFTIYGTLTMAERITDFVSRGQRRKPGTGDLERVREHSQCYF